METPKSATDNDVDLEQQLAEALAELSEDITEEDSTFDTSSIESDEVDLEGNLSDNQNHHDLTFDNVIVLKPIHSIIQQLNKPKIKEHAGIPTCIAVDEFIAVGTSHGLSLIFNSNHQLTTIIGNSENGGITCIDLNIIAKDSIYWCVCGHSNGTIVLWDMVTKKQIKTLKYYSSPILCVKFLPDTNRNRFIVSDINGVVNVFTVSKVLLVNVVEGQLILNGNAGPILCLAPLMISVSTNDTSYSLPYSIIAFATAQRVYIITLYTNSVEVHYKIEKPKGISLPKGITIATIPTIAWTYVQPSIANRNKTESVKTKQKRGGIYLAVGWGNVIELFQLHLDNETGKLMFPRINQIRLNSGDFINAIAWLSSRVLVVVDVLEQLRVIDPFAPGDSHKYQLDTMDIKSLQLVYTRLLPNKPRSTNQKKASNSKHSSTPSDVSTPKMTRYFYMQSLGSQGNHIFLLVMLSNTICDNRQGLEGVYDGLLFTWQERIDNLVLQKKFTLALKLASMFYHDEISVVIGNLPADTSRRKQIIAHKIIQILTSYQTHAFEMYTSHIESQGKTNLKLSKTMIEELGVRCIEYCCLIDRVDILYGIIFDKYKQLAQQSPAGTEVLNKFLELLEPAILRGSLTYVAPEVIQLWIDHYQQSSNMLRRAEQCILHLPISSLDFHQVSTLCKKHNLLVTFIYLYNRGLNDFATPLEHILNVIQSNLDNLDNSKTRKGHSMSVVNTCVSYIQCTLQGRYYSDVALVLSVTQSNISGFSTTNNLANIPTPSMEPQELEDARNQILQFLFLADDSGNFPRLKVFIDGLVESAQVAITSPSKTSASKGSVSKLLDCLHLVFDDESYSVKAKVTYNMMMDALLIVFGIAGSSATKPAARSTLSSFIQFEVYQFIVEYYSKGKLDCSHRPVLLNFIIGFLAADDLDMDPQYRSIVLNNTPTDDTNPVHSAKETVFLMLASRLFSPSGSVPNMDLDRVLLQAEGSHFYKVGNYLYQLKRNYNKIIECQIRDPSLKFIKSILDCSTNNTMQEQSDSIPFSPPATMIPITEDDKELLKTATINHLHELITIDSHLTTKLMMQYFTSQQDKVLRKLDPHPHLQFIYLSNLFAKEHFQSQTSDNNSKTLVTKSGVVITGDIQILYVKLMCIYSPSNVYNYLVSQINYPLDECLNICRQYKVTDATAYLLERTGDVPGALTLLLEVVTASLIQLHKYYRNESDGNMYQEAFPSGIQEKDSYARFVSCISLCQRNSQKLQDTENEALWFRLLDVVVEPLRKLRDQSPSLKGTLATENPSAESKADHRMQECLTHLVQLSLSSMMGYVPFGSILSKIVTDHGANAFGDFKAIIIAMMDTYTFEKTILEIACHLTDQDMHSAVKDFYKKRSRAFHPKVSKCIICSRPLSAKFDDLGKSFSSPKSRTIIEAESDSIFQTDPNQKLGTHESSLITIFACGHAYHRVCLKTGVEHSHVSSAGCTLCSKKDEKDPFAKTNDNNILDNNNDNTQENGIRAQFKEKLDEQLLLKAKQKKNKKSFTAVIKEDTPRYHLFKNLQAETRKQRRMN